MKTIDLIKLALYHHIVLCGHEKTDDPEDVAEGFEQTLEGVMPDALPQWKAVPLQTRLKWVRECLVTVNEGGQ